MNYDLNDAQPQMPPIGDLIPDGTFAKIRMSIRPGGLNGSVPMDAGLLKASQSSDAKMLDCEFTVVDGPLARRKFWQNFTVAGGKLDEKGASKGWNITKSTIRAMINSALGLNPNDMSAEAKQKRVIQGLRQLDGIVFIGRIMVEPTSNPQYKDVNRLANVVVPGEPQYAAIMRGESVKSEPINARPRKAAETPAQQKPAWGNSAQPSQPQAMPWSGSPAGSSGPPAPSAGPAWLNG